ncbi:UDP-N-acetylenolpyruvoylglucosamine reductase, partial [Patescibacteria group bacterium]|nr:UDP-N-acetylenolpyruvoylglucosamine reductase [Patescibacteria group bacterium]
ETLETDYPDIKYFDTPNDQIKVSAAWLIEHLGYKGVQNGSVGTYDKHALVLVNRSGATGSEVWSFAKTIMDHVQSVFGITLEPEVLIL